ncbi:sigma-70 family RNA polymerase sigma factor [Solwaraspora sp. WMMB762]|uniref:sigma-70 family RNA polymerase sigma factor n=1 Tax=Solwaraspora sp. WMMB762 TaxID=3404120 RepID=UPI003B934FEA
MTHSSAEAELGLPALVLDAQAGDQQALNELIAGHLPLIYNIVGRALHGHADVDDLVQETALRLIRGLPSLREPGRFRAWAVSVTYRQIQQYLRERKRALLRVRDDATPAELADPDDVAERTVGELMLTGQRRELAEAVRWLEPDDRRLLALWWQEVSGELTRSELAAALGVPPPHAAVRLQRLRDRLDATRTVVRVLRAAPRCTGLRDLLHGWDGSTDGRWRKRLIRHCRTCDRCGIHRVGLVAPEELLPSVAPLPLPLALLEGVRIACEAAAPATLTPAAAGGQSIGQLVLTQLNGLFQQKAAAVATAVAVAAGGGFVYAVQEKPLPGGGDASAVASPTAARRAAVPAVPAPVASSPPASATAVPTSPPAVSPADGVTSADVYVAPDGSDDGDGSRQRPYATLDKAVSVVEPGQTIALRGGTYRPSDPVVIDVNGAPERRITLSNYAGEWPVIDASGVPADKWMVTHRGSFWTVQGLEVMNSGSHAYVCVSCRDNIFRRLSMHHNARSGLTLRDEGTTGNQVLDSDFHTNYDPAEAGGAGVGLAVKFGDGTGNVVRGCRAFGNASDGFDVGHFADPVLLEANWAYGNGVNRWAVADWHGAADGFRLGGGSPAPAAGHLLRDNAAWDNTGHGFADGGNAGALDLTGNTAFRNGGAGFHLPVPQATLVDNAAVGNGTDGDNGDVQLSGGRSQGNTWDGGSWSVESFRSIDPASAQGPRRPDGRLPETTFLTSDTDIGASMLAP